MNDLTKNNEEKKNGFLNCINSGVKGNLTHITQSCEKVGIQLNDISQRNLFKMNYYFKNDISAYGHISRSFINGLTALEFYLHLFAARIGLIGAACKTSITGYLNRKISKFVEDLKIYYDGSVRNANGQIIMFHYGFDTSMLCNYHIQITKLSINEVIDFFTFFFNHNSKNHNNNLKEIHSCLSEISKLLILRYRLLQHNYIPNLIALPTDIQVLKRLLTNFEKKNHNQNQNQNQICLIEVRESISELWLYLVTEYHIPNSELYEAAYFECFSTKNLFLYGCLKTKEHFDLTLKWISQRYISQLCHTGAAKGHDAVQGLVEPSTQANLKIFHISGEKNVLTDGVQRLSELVNLVPNIATPCMEIFIQKEFELTFDPLKSLVELYIDSIVENFFDKPHDMHNNNNNNNNNNNEIIDDNDIVILTLYLKRDQMMQRKLSPKNLAEKLLNSSRILQRDKNNCIITYSNLKDLKWWLTFKIHRESKIIKSFSKSTEPIPLLSLQFYHALRYEKTLLAGISNIKDFYKCYKTIQIKDEENDNKLINVQRLVYETKGSNLLGICLLPEVDIEFTKTNDIHQIYKLFGIDAAKNALENELYKTMLGIEATISARHVTLIAHVMCVSGIPTALTFAGMNSSKHCSSYLKLSTFERSLDSFLGAGISAHSDDLKGVSESLIAGTKMSLGTGGSFELISDLHLLPKCHEENIKTILRNAKKNLISLKKPNIDFFLRQHQEDGEVEEEILTFKLIKPLDLDGSFKNFAQKRKVKKLDLQIGGYDLSDAPSSPKAIQTKYKKQKLNWIIDLDSIPSSP